MTTNSARAAARIPELTDGPPNINTAVGNAVNDLDKVVVPIYASTAARDTAEGTPVEGRHCYISNTTTGGRTLQQYNGSAWVPIFRSPQYVRKPSSTSRLSGAGMFADPFLTLPVISNGIYYYFFHLFAFGNSSADILARVAFPTGSDVSVSGTGADSSLGTGATLGGGEWRAWESDTSSPTINIPFGTSDLTNRVGIHLDGLATIGSTSGSLTLEWGNASSNINGVEILTGSYMLLTRVG